MTNVQPPPRPTSGRYLSHLEAMKDREKVMDEAGDELTDRLMDQVKALEDAMGFNITPPPHYRCAMWMTAQPENMSALQAEFPDEYDKVIRDFRRLRLRYNRDETFRAKTDAAIVEIQDFEAKKLVEAQAQQQAEMEQVPTI